MKRLLIAAAMMSLAGTPFASAQPKSSGAAAMELYNCAERNFQPGIDKSQDGGKSTMRLLLVCANQWQAYSDNCVANGANDKGTCNLIGGFITQIFLFEKEGRPIPPAMYSLLKP